MNKMNPIRKLTATFLLVLLALQLSAHERKDTAYVFRFVPNRDMFYVPWQGNGNELARLKACINTHRNRILAGEIPLRVDGYCNSKESEAANLAVAKIRSNRVKSELISRQKLTEECFMTHNHSGGGNYVTVRLVVPIPDKEKETTTDVRTDTMIVAEDNRRAEPVETITEPVITDTVQKAQTVPAVAEEAMAPKPYTFSLRANLLRWATLTPDLGIEWRINPSWGIQVNGSWTSWSWDDKNRRYALWEVAPEVRYYIGKEKRGYLGAMYKAGSFNYKLSATGKQGDLMGGGITGGYQLKLNNALSLDFNLGLGYIRADYDKYTVIDGVRVRDGKETKDWWGPVSAGVTLTWNIF